MVSTKPDTFSGLEEPLLPPHTYRDKITLIIPTYYYDDEIRKMTEECVRSIGKGIDELIVQEDLVGEGYTKTVNTALQAATGDIIIIGNNDLIFPGNWLRGLLRVFEEGFDVATCWTSDQKLAKVEPVIKEHDKFGSIFAMKREVYNVVGPLDEVFKGYFADTDYQERLKRWGFRTGINCNLVIYHKAKATYSKTDPNDKEYEMARILFEQKWEFAP